ncbi:MAG: thrB [Patescibacteria group bacterium]|jgi:Ser/Thr protein kinase RdoA (MazF antagonist)|nr:thrB [Patescibacteria group bacterium]
MLQLCLYGVPTIIKPKEILIIGRILSGYGIPAARILAPQSGYRNRAYPVILPDQTALNLILYKSEPGIVVKIRHANHVSDFLAGRGLPARGTYDPRIIRLRAPTRDKYGALYRYLPGRTIPWEAYTQAHIKLLGGTLSAMHAALRELPTGVQLNPVEDEYEAIIGRLSTYFGMREVRTALAAKIGYVPRPATLGRMRHVLRLCRALPSSQALHMDFVRGNILFGGAGEGLYISGILDFEKTATGHPVFDIARTLAFLLVDCKYKTEAQIRKYFLVSGYNRRGQAHFDTPVLKSHNHQLDVLEELVDLFLIYDWYKFLRHNPYEYLDQNEHYVRTTGILMERGIITPLKVLDKIGKTV